MTDLISLLEWQYDAAGEAVVTDFRVMAILDRPPSEQFFLCGIPWIVFFVLAYIFVEYVCVKGSTVGVPAAESASNILAAVHGLISGALATYILYVQSQRILCVCPRYSLDRVPVILSGGYFWSHGFIMIGLHHTPSIVARRKAVGIPAKLLLPLLHHYGVLFFFYQSIVLDKSVSINTYMLFTEISTFFLCIAYEYQLREMAGGLIFNINGIILFITFFLCRIVFQPWLIYKFSINRLCWDWAADNLPGTFASAYVCMVLLYALNVFWFRALLERVISKVSDAFVEDFVYYTPLGHVVKPMLSGGDVKKDS